MLGDEPECAGVRKLGRELVGGDIDAPALSPDEGVVPLDRHREPQARSGREDVLGVALPHREGCPDGPDRGSGAFGLGGPRLCEGVEVEPGAPVTRGEFRAIDLDGEVVDPERVDRRQTVFQRPDLTTLRSHRRAPVR